MLAYVHYAINLYQLILVATAIMSWFPPTGFALELQRALRVLTDPVLTPLRRVLPRPRMGVMAIDLSVIVAILGLSILARVIPW